MSRPIYLPFADGQWRMSMGLKALNLDEWIEIGDRFVTELALKERLLKERYSDVFACIPDSQASQKEALELLVEHLCDRFPQNYRRQDKTIENITTGQVWTSSDFETAPLDLAGRLVQEDLLLVQPSPEGYRLAAASVCFPLRWRLQEKLGRSLSQIHSPVPDYQEKLARPIDSFFDRLKCDRPAWRLNWSILDSPNLFLPSNSGQPSVYAAITAQNAGEMLWLRVERQTLRRLSESGDILFTIRTYVHCLQAIAHEPEMARNLAKAIEQIPFNMQRYKTLLPIRDALLGYLNRLG
jgi:dimethylamine monooxygenase subunit A